MMVIERNKTQGDPEIKAIAENLRIEYLNAAKNDGMNDNDFFLFAYGLIEDTVSPLKEQLKDAEKEIENWIKSER